jgi:hypothetical protein
MSLEFSDGVKFDTDGPLRIEKRWDGYYVVGRGMLMFSGSREEALEDLAEMKAVQERRTS